MKKRVRVKGRGEKLSVKRVLKHIAFARDWLARAEERIQRGSIVEGEVYLSLAEAEVRKAWEDSYFSRKKPLPGAFWFKKGFIPFLLVIILLFALGFSSYRDNFLARKEGTELKLIFGNWLQGENYEGWRERNPEWININLMEENNMGGVRD